MTSELDQLREEYIDMMKMGQTEEAHRVLDKRDKILLAQKQDDPEPGIDPTSWAAFRASASRQGRKQRHE